MESTADVLETAFLYVVLPLWLRGLGVAFQAARAAACLPHDLAGAGLLLVFMPFVAEFRRCRQTRPRRACDDWNAGHAESRHPFSRIRNNT